MPYSNGISFLQKYLVHYTILINVNIFIKNVYTYELDTCLQNY